MWRHVFSPKWSTQQQKKENRSASHLAFHTVCQRRIYNYLDEILKDLHWCGSVRRPLASRPRFHSSPRHQGAQARRHSKLFSPLKFPKADPPELSSLLFDQRWDRPWSRAAFPAAFSHTGVLQSTRQTRKPPRKSLKGKKRVADDEVNKGQPL